MYCITRVMIASSLLIEVRNAQRIGKTAKRTMRKPSSQVRMSARRLRELTASLPHDPGEADIEVGEEHQEREHHDRERARVAEVELAVGLLKGVEREHLRRAPGAAAGE